MEENAFDRFRDTKHGDILPSGEMDAVDITPSKIITVKDIGLLYNKADVATQLDFIKLLIQHDFDKVQHALKGKI